MGALLNTPPPPGAPGEGDEWLSRNERTHVARRAGPGGSTRIFKYAVCSEATQRLRHETEVLARLQGVDGIPRVDLALCGPDVLAMADDGGTPLSRRLRDGPLDAATAVAYAHALAGILAALHRRGVVHHDVNPSNLLVTPDGRPVLIDFDLASAAADDSGAPRGDPRDDLFALGATLHEMLTGRAPFATDDAVDPARLAQDHRATPPIAREVRVAGLPPSLSALVWRLLEEDPESRYQSADGVAHDLARIAAGEAAPFALGALDFPPRLTPPRLVGRDAARARLLGLLDAPATRVRCVLVVGEQGTGKTALIESLRPDIGERGGRLIGLDPADGGPAGASNAVLRLLDAIAARLLSEPGPAIEPRRDGLLAALGPNAALLSALLPTYRTLLAVPPRLPAIGAVSTGARLFESAIAVLREVATAERPVVIAVDNLTWATPGLARLLDALLQADGLAHVRVLGVLRDADLEPDHPLTAVLSGLSREHREPLTVRLANLAPDDLATLLVEMLRLSRDEADRLAGVIGERTLGNPLDTIELMNAVRSDGVLRLLATGWAWTAADILRYVGRGNVVDLLGARIGRLSAPTRAALEAMACLGNEVPLALLAAATGEAPAVLAAALHPALEDGLLARVSSAERRLGLRAEAQEAATGLRFWHPRVQRALVDLLDDAHRTALHLRFARALQPHEAFAEAAAQQYRAADHRPDDLHERLRMAELLQTVGERALELRYDDETAEPLIRHAVQLLQQVEPAGGIGPAALAARRASAEASLVAALYAQGRHDAVVAAYRTLCEHCDDPMLLARSTAVALTALMSLGRPADVLATGWAAIERIEAAGAPDAADATAGDLPGGWQHLRRWADALDVRTEIARPPTPDPRVPAVAHVLGRMTVVASAARAEDTARIVLRAQRLWERHGPSADLLLPIAHAVIPAVGLHGDYRVGYLLGRICLGIAASLEDDWLVAVLKNTQATYAQPWFESLEACLAGFRAARATLVPYGIRLTASYNHSASLSLLFDSAPTLDDLDGDIDAAHAACARVRNAPALGTVVAHRRMLRVLRGQTSAPGRFSAPDFDEQAFLLGIGAHAVPRAQYHLHRALAAALFGDTAALAVESSAAMTMVAPRANYRAVHAHVLHAVSLSRQLREGVGAHAPDLAAALDRCRDWMAARAEDSPANFGPLLLWIDAERAWAQGDTLTAARHFDAALQEIGRHKRPWQQALMTEEAALLHLAHGLESLGRSLMLRARDLYDAWGASEKVRALRRAHAFVPAPPRGPAPGAPPHAEAKARPTTYRGTGLLLDEVDMLAILRSSQALSSETRLHRLCERVGTLMAKLTGATGVRLVMREGANGPWQRVATQPGAAPCTVEQAAAAGELPLSAFRYVERTGEALRVDDLGRDDRFARDGHVATLAGCSLLAVPVVRQGELRGVLMLEHRQRRAAFAADRLDAVTLIAGQLAVSLDNAMRYDALERQLAVQTRALEAANEPFAARWRGGRPMPGWAARARAMRRPNAQPSNGRK